MAYSLSCLPSRFPVGTKFVIEGRRGREGQVQIFSRHLEFPDGTLLPLPARPAVRPAKRKMSVGWRSRRVRDRRP